MNLYVRIIQLVAVDDQIRSGHFNLKQHRAATIKSVKIFNFGSQKGLEIHGVMNWNKVIRQTNYVPRFGKIRHGRCGHC